MAYDLNELLQTVKSAEEKLKAMDSGAQRAMDELNMALADRRIMQRMSRISANHTVKEQFELHLFLNFTPPNLPPGIPADMQPMQQIYLGSLKKETFPTEEEAYAEVRGFLEASVLDDASPLMLALATVRIAVAQQDKEQIRRNLLRP